MLHGLGHTSAAFLAEKIGKAIYSSAQEQMFQMKFQDDLHLPHNSASYPIKDSLCHQTDYMGLLIVLI